MTDTPKAIEVNSEHDNMARIEEAIRVNTTQVTDGARAEAVAGEEGKKAAGEKETPTGEVAMGLAEDVVLGAAAKVAVNVAQIALDNDPGKHGGHQTMEDVIKGKAKSNASPVSTTAGKARVAEAKQNSQNGGVKKDITGQKVKVPKEADAFRCIKGKHINDVFGRASNASKSINGKDPIKGAKQDEKAATSLQKSCQAVVTKTLSLDAAGRAKMAKAELGAKIAKQPQQQQQMAQAPKFGLDGPARGPQPKGDLSGSQSGDGNEDWATA